MTLVGLVVLDVAALLLLAWLLNLVRVGRLYAGYAIIFMGAVVLVAIGCSVPALSAPIGRALHELFPGTGVLVSALAFVVLVLVYVLTQVTLLAHRVATIAQDLAIERAGPPRPPQRGE